MKPTINSPTDVTSITHDLAYVPVVITQFMQPLHAGSLAGQAGVVSGQAGSRARGASVRLWLQVQGGHVRQARFEAYGCPHFLAAAECLATWCEGRQSDQLRDWPWQTLATELAVPAAKRARLLVLEDALRNVMQALDHYT